MAVPPKESGLSNEQRYALALLASFPHGITEERLVLAHGFDRDMIADLVHEGLAIMHRETVETGGQTIEVVRLTITAVGRRAIQR
jgi:hypothetical protein